MAKSVKVKKSPIKAKKKKAVKTVPHKVSGLPSIREEIDRLHTEIDRTFENMFAGWRLPSLMPHFFDIELPRLPALEIGMGFPKVNMVETETDYKITAETAGLGDEDIEVVLTENALTLKGEKSEVREEKEHDYHLSERRFGSFSRSLPVPRDVDRDKIDASTKKGILTIVLPKTAESRKKRRKIKVKEKKE